MLVFRIGRVLLILIIAYSAVLGLTQVAMAQSDERSQSATEKPNDVDLDVELHILVASNTPESAKLVSSLDRVAKQLRTTLPFPNYRLGATFLSRVKNGRTLSVKGVGRTLFVTPMLEGSVLPTFYEMSAGTMTLKSDAAGRPAIQISGFRFGLRVPLQSSSSAGGPGAPPVVYEHIGITTDLTVREGEAVVVGTLDAGRPNETLVLVLVIRRVS